MKSGKTWKNWGIFFLSRNLFCTLVVFTLSLSIRMPNYFLGLSKTTGKNVKKSGNF